MIEMNKAKYVRFGKFILMLIIISVLVGVGSGLLAFLLEFIEYIALGFIESAHYPAAYNTSALRRFLSVSIALSLAGVIWYFLRNKTQKVPSVSQAVKGEQMPTWQTIVHVCTQIGIVGAGASIGRETSPRELGSLIAQKVCKLFSNQHLNIQNFSTGNIVALAASAGLAAVYDAPFAGMFFAVEILLKTRNIALIFSSSCMSFIAAYIAGLMRGTDVYYEMPYITKGFAIDYQIIVFAIIAGVICGVVGWVFRHCFKMAQVKQVRNSSIFITMPMVGVLSGVLAYFMPQIMGNGRAAAQLALLVPDNSMYQNMWRILLITLIAKMLITLVTIHAGASGGVIQPAIASGAIIGLLLGGLWCMLSLPQVNFTMCALIGAVAFLAASQQAALMSLSLVIELTHAPLILVIPAVIAAIIALQFSKIITSYYNKKQI
ncbi:MAG: chloride channel protein [Bifidobacteriaceae bacterium]|nr:chloride channel protein [Bifidobacteriaceae bacterium]